MAELGGSDKFLIIFHITALEVTLPIYDHGPDFSVTDRQTDVQ